jgi:hypothetical protein
MFVREAGHTASQGAREQIDALADLAKVRTRKRVVRYTELSQPAALASPSSVCLMSRRFEQDPVRSTILPHLIAVSGVRPMWSRALHWRIDQDGVPGGGQGLKQHGIVDALLTISGGRERPLEPSTRLNKAIQSTRQAKCQKDIGPI